MKKLILTLTVLIMAFFQCLAQAPDTSWTKTLGGSANEYAEGSSISQTSDGGYIVASSSWSNDGDVHGNHGMNDAWIVKLNNSGDTTWTKTLGGSHSDNGRSISQTSDGGYIVAGSSLSNDGDVHGNHGNCDYWIIKLNNSGDTTWTKTLGGSSVEYPCCIEQTSDGGYIVAGVSRSNDGDVHGHHGGVRDIWIVKLNNSGDITWTKTLGGSGDDQGLSISQTSDGGYIVAGNTNSNNGDVHGNHGIVDAWIVKLNNNGDTTWTKTLGGSERDYAYSITQTTDGGYIVAGASKSNDGDVHGNNGSADFWIIKLNNSGDTTWTKTLGGSNYDHGFSIYQTSDGGYIVAGSSSSNDGDVHGNHGQYDSWIVKLNNSGDTTWTKTLGGSNNEHVYTISQTSDGGYIAAGTSESNNGDVHGSHGYKDYWIVKLEPDNLPPVAACQNVTVSSDENCEAIVTAEQVDNNSYDPNGDPITLSLNPPGPYQLGETTVTLLLKMTVVKLINVRQQ